MNDADVIVALGGQTCVARGIRAPVATVDAWKQKSRIPLWRRPAVAALAAKKGMSLPPGWEDSQNTLPPYHSAPLAVSRQDTEKSATKVAGGKACSAPPGAGAALEPIVICALCERELTPTRNGACQYLDCPAKERE